MRIIVTGGRDFVGYDLVFKTLLDYIHKQPTIVHGDARGADTLAKEIAEEFKMTVEPHAANWAEFDGQAGFVRNQEMVDLGADLVIAFPGGNGTRDCIRRAHAAGIPVRHA